MSYSLPADCLNEVFENLEDDKITLHSCLLVSRFWCKISVRILWRDIWIYKRSVNKIRQLEVASSILCTLISCLPVESKELLDKNEIFISTPTSNPPLFDYAAFCKVLKINNISGIIHDVLESDTSISSQNLKDKNCIILKEMLKMFMNQISSLKMLVYYYNVDIPDYISFTSFPGAKDCLTDLSELHCGSDIHSEFFYQLSQICHNLRSLTINFMKRSKVSEGLKELVSSQNNLKNLKLSAYNWNDFANTTVIPALMKHSNTLTKLHLCAYGHFQVIGVRLSFVSSFLNLQEIKISFDPGHFEDFEKLQYVTFPKLRILKIPYQYPNPVYMMKFLETNGKSLQELYIGKASNLSVDKYCPNLKKLFVKIGCDKLESDMLLKIIFNSCQDLEGIVILCGVYLNEKEVLETVAKHSPKNFYELKLIDPKLIPENLESFLVSWKNRASKKSLGLIIVGNKLKVKEESRKIIEKYINLGVIKKFEIRKYFSKELYL